MPFITIDRDVLIDKIYEFRGQIEPDNKEAQKKIEELISLIASAPLEEKSAYPRIRMSR